MYNFFYIYLFIFRNRDYEKYSKKLIKHGENLIKKEKRKLVSNQFDIIQILSFGFFCRKCFFRQRLPYG